MGIIQEIQKVSSYTWSKSALSQQTYQHTIVSARALWPNHLFMSVSVLVLVSGQLSKLQRKGDYTQLSCQHTRAKHHQEIITVNWQLFVCLSIRPSLPLYLSLSVYVSPPVFLTLEFWSSGGSRWPEPSIFIVDPESQRLVFLPRRRVPWMDVNLCTLILGLLVRPPPPCPRPSQRSTPLQVLLLIYAKMPPFLNWLQKILLLWQFLCTFTMNDFVWKGSGIYTASLSLA